MNSLLYFYPQNFQPWATLVVEVAIAGRERLQVVEPHKLPEEHLQSLDGKDP
jgi:hypothetical protein